MIKTKIKYSLPESIFHLFFLLPVCWCFLIYFIRPFYNDSNFNDIYKIMYIGTPALMALIYFFVFRQYPLKTNFVFFNITLLVNFINAMYVGVSIIIFIKVYFSNKSHPLISIVDNYRSIFLIIPMIVYLSAFLNKKLFYSLVVITISIFLITLSLDYYRVYYL